MVASFKLRSIYFREGSTFDTVHAEFVNILFWTHDAAAAYF